MNDAALNLLALLGTQAQSGDALGGRLGVGRVTVNAWARALQESGVPVQISRAGYALEPGTPAPGLVRVCGELGRALRYAGTVGSTQDEIRAWADAPEPAPHGAVFVAERQTAGRGRRGRTWDTSGGSLVFSVLLRGEKGELPLPRLALLPLAAGVAVQQAASELGVPCGLKWPNDLLTPERKKLAGILLEADLRGEEARRAVLGIGINVSSAPPGAACLNESGLNESGPGLTRAEVLAAVLDALDFWLAQPAPAILQAWRERNLTLSQQVQVQTGGGTITGIAQDLDAQGSLTIQLPDGQNLTVSAGDVQLVGDWSGGPAP